MIERSIITAFFLLGLAKATTGGIRMLVMAGIGLAGMYMIHLLAQDFNRIRNGRSVHGVVRRSINSDYGLSDANFDNATSKSILRDIELAEERYRTNEIMSLNRILQFDPTGCARRYVCTIGAKSYKKRSRSEKNIIRMLRNLPANGKSDTGHEAFNHALNLGIKKKDPEACAEEYPKCLFSVSQMLKLVGFL